MNTTDKENLINKFDKIYNGQAEYNSYKNMKNNIFLDI